MSIRAFSRFTLAAALALLALRLPAQAVPGTLNYQGRLTDNGPSQVPVSAVVPMRFALYDAASAGTQLWREPASGGLSVTVTGGVFSVLLGGDTAIPASVFTGASADRWLEITLNPGTAGEEILAPRQKLATQGYAALAENANSAASAATAATATNATQLNAHPDTYFLPATGVAADSAKLGGVAAASWQRALSPAACPSNQYYTGIAQNGSANCAAAVVTESDPKVGTLTSGRIPRWGGSALADGAFFDNGSAVGLGAAAGGGSLFDLNGSITQSSYNARLLMIDGTLRSDANGQAYLAGAVIAPTYNYTQGYGNYAWGLVVNAPAPVAGSQTVHSIVTVQGAQPTAASECNVNFGSNVPNQQPSLCNGRYGLYLGDANTQYNYLSANLGIKNNFPATELDVTGSGRASTSFLSPLFASRTTGESLIVKAQNGAGNGGALTLRSGDSSATSGGAGGNVSILAGGNTPQGGAGYTNLGPAGTITLTGGPGYNSAGGAIAISAGQTSYWALASDAQANVTISGGVAQGGDAAVLTVGGGRTLAAGNTTTRGGDLTLAAGNAVGGNPGGSVLITAGSGTPNGRVQVNGALVRTGSAASISVNGLYCGYSVSTTGVFSSGGQSGYRAAKVMCETACGSAYAHMCDPGEILRSMQTGFTGLVGVGYWYATAAANGSGGDCNGFTSGSSAGPMFAWSNPGIVYSTVSCSSTLGPIACCL